MTRYGLKRIWISWARRSIRRVSDRLLFSPERVEHPGKEQASYSSTTRYGATL
jgi:hypothetical protein